MRIMYDAVNWRAIPSGAAMVAGYYNGAESMWPPEAWQRFKAAQHVTIDVLGDAPRWASVLDVERGDATPEHAPNWIRSRNSLFPGTATIYCSRANWEAVRSACNGGGVSPHYWIADWTGEPHELAGAVAVQYAHPGNGSEGDYDMTAVYDDSWHAAPTWADHAVELLRSIEQAVPQLVALVEAHR